MEKILDLLNNYICYDFMKSENISDELLEMIGEFAKIDNGTNSYDGIEEFQVPYPRLNLNPFCRYIGLYYTINERIWIGYDCKKSSGKPFCVSIQQRNGSNFPRKLEEKDIEYEANNVGIDKKGNRNGFWYTVYIGNESMGISQLLQERDKIINLI